MSRFDSGALQDDPEFTAYYEQWLRPLEARHRANAGSAMRSSLIRGAQSLALALGLAAGMFWFSDTWGGPGGWLVLVTLGIVALVLVVWTIDPARTHTQATKSRITPILVGYFGDFRFEQKAEFGLAPFIDWEFLEQHDRRKFGDVITGSYRGVPIRIAELFLDKRHSEVGRSATDWTRVFSGVFADYVLPAPVAALTLVVNENPLWRKRAEQRGWNHLDFAADGYHAFALGEVDDAYPLPEALGALLDGLRTTFRAKHVLAAFGESRLVILLEGASNAFEPAVTGNASLHDEAETIRAQLGSLAKVVDALGIGPSTDIRDQPRPVNEKALEAKAKTHVDDFKGLGCLPLMVLSTALFLVYGWILHDTASATLAFAFSLIASPLLASAILKLYELLRGPRRKGLSSQLLKIGIATVPVYFLLMGIW